MFDNVDCVGVGEIFSDKTVVVELVICFACCCVFVLFKVLMHYNPTLDFLKMMASCYVKWCVKGATKCL